VPKLGDITNVWSTIKELNVAEIRDEAEAPVTIAVIGASAARATIMRALRGQPSKFPAVGSNPLREYDLPLGGERQHDLRGAALIVVVVEGDAPASTELQRTLDRLTLVDAPVSIVCLGASALPRQQGGKPIDTGGLPIVYAPDSNDQTLREAVIPGLAARIPDDQRVAAARRLPGLRDAIARELIGDTSFSNATYALTTGVPELVPVLNIPLNAADMVVLTKNQALMVYRLGLAYGSPADFQAQMREVLSVVGGGFMWRQIARQAIGFVPYIGLFAKVAVAYAGTHATGQAAAIWYGRGEVLSREALLNLYKQALEIGRERASALVSRSRRRAKDGAARRRGLRRFLPGGREPSAPQEPPAT
jgi:uncharacterized protein (DUF697 family)